MFVFIFVIKVNSKAQDVENVLKADSVGEAMFHKVLSTPLVLNGQVNARSLFYMGSSQSDPFTYLFNGNMSIGFMKYSMPLSFTFTNKNLKYAASSPLRFNRFNFSPYYKWVRLYLGSSSMSFSPYTLDGVQFRGLGIELTPKGAFSGSVMYGKFYEAVNYNPDLPYVQPVFKRTGYALKMAYNKDKVMMETSLLSATDHPSSISLPTDTVFSLAALQNLAVNFKTRLTPLDEVNFDIEYATSAVNYLRLYQTQSFFDLLFDGSEAISRYNAYKLNINFTPGKMIFGAGIEHIDPGFTTLGTYYSRNDFQNLTLNVGSSLLKSKLNLMVNGGLENDDLKNQNTRKTTRSVGSANVNYQPSQKMNLTLSYSNFQSFSNLKNQFDDINDVNPLNNMDTLNYMQLNQSASMAVVCKVKETENRTQSIRLMCNLSQSKAQQGNVTNGGTAILNTNGSWSAIQSKSKRNLSAGFNSTLSNANSQHTFIWGPVMSWAQPFLNKQMQANSSFAYNQTLVNGRLMQWNINLRGNLEYTYHKIHRFGAELALLMRKPVTQPKFSEVRMTLSYTLAFKKREIYLTKRSTNPNSVQ